MIRHENEPDHQNVPRPTVAPTPEASAEMSDEDGWQERHDTSYTTTTDAPSTTSDDPDQQNFAIPTLAPTPEASTVEISDEEDFAIRTVEPTPEGSTIETWEDGQEIDVEMTNTTTTDASAKTQAPTTETVGLAEIQDSSPRSSYDGIRITGTLLLIFTIVAYAFLLWLARRRRKQLDEGETTGGPSPLKSTGTHETRQDVDLEMEMDPPLALIGLQMSSLSSSSDTESLPEKELPSDEIQGDSPLESTGIDLETEMDPPLALIGIQVSSNPSLSSSSDTVSLPEKELPSDEILMDWDVQLQEENAMELGAQRAWIVPTQKKELAEELQWGRWPSVAWIVPTEKKPVKELRWGRWPRVRLKVREIEEQIRTVSGHDLSVKHIRQTSSGDD